MIDKDKKNKLPVEIDFIRQRIICSSTVVIEKRKAISFTRNPPTTFTTKNSAFLCISPHTRNWIALANAGKKKPQPFKCRC